MELKNISMSCWSKPRWTADIGEYRVEFGLSQQSYPFCGYKAKNAIISFIATRVVLCTMKHTEFNHDMELLANRAEKDVAEYIDDKEKQYAQEAKQKAEEEQTKRNEFLETLTLVDALHPEEVILLPEDSAI